MLTKIKLLAEWVFDQFILPFLAPFMPASKPERKSGDDSIAGD